MNTTVIILLSVLIPFAVGVVAILMYYVVRRCRQTWAEESHGGEANVIQFDKEIVIVQVQESDGIRSPIHLGESKLNDESESESERRDVSQSEISRDVHYAVSSAMETPARRGKCGTRSFLHEDYNFELERRVFKEQTDPNRPRRLSGANPPPRGRLSAQWSGIVKGMNFGNFVESVGESESEGDPMSPPRPTPDGFPRLPSAPEGEALDANPFTQSPTTPHAPTTPTPKPPVGTRVCLEPDETGDAAGEEGPLTPDQRVALWRRRISERAKGKFLAPPIHGEGVGPLYMGEVALRAGMCVPCLARDAHGVRRLFYMVVEEPVSDHDDAACAERTSAGTPEEAEAESAERHGGSGAPMESREYRQRGGGSVTLLPVSHRNGWRSPSVADSSTLPCDAKNVSILLRRRNGKGAANASVPFGGDKSTKGKTHFTRHPGGNETGSPRTVASLNSLQSPFATSNATISAGVSQTDDESIWRFWLGGLRPPKDFNYVRTWSPDGEE